jgi:hypothetical protein
MPLGGRRAGRATSFDVFNDTTGALVVRNIDATAVITTYCTGLTAEQVLGGVAGYSYVVNNGFRAAAHMSIQGP